MTTTLRHGRAALHDRLNAAAGEIHSYGSTGPLWTRGQLRDLLAEARDAVIRCPHLDCAYCYTVERQETR